MGCNSSLCTFIDYSVFVARFFALNVNNTKRMKVLIFLKVKFLRSFKNAAEASSPIKKCQIAVTFKLQFSIMLH